MKRIAILLALSGAAAFAFCQTHGGDIFRMTISDPEHLLANEDGLVGQEFQDVDFKMTIVKPDPAVDYQIIFIKPDPKTSYTMVVIDPKTKKEVPVPKKLEERILSMLEEYKKK